MGQQAGALGRIRKRTGPKMTATPLFVRGRVRSCLGRVWVVTGSCLFVSSKRGGQLERADSSRGRLATTHAMRLAKAIT